MDTSHGANTAQNTVIGTRYEQYKSMQSAPVQLSLWASLIA